MASTPRRYVIGGNWKCNGKVAEVEKLVAMLNSAGEMSERVEVIVAPTALHIGAVRAGLRRDVAVAAQNVGVHGTGAFTGELSVELLRDFGLTWTIIGHSERRALFGETDSVVARKTKAALAGGMSVILCCGETLEEREAGRMLEVLTRQLAAVVAEIPADAWARVVIAYEPVWAIGTGKVASNEQAQEVHRALREWLAGAAGAAVAAAMRIIYGGSVKGSNAAGLIEQADIDGFLVGGASLKPEFLEIIAAAAH